MLSKVDHEILAPPGRGQWAAGTKTAPNPPGRGQRAAGSGD